MTPHSKRESSRRWVAQIILAMVLAGTGVAVASCTTPGAAERNRVMFERYLDAAERGDRKAAVVLGSLYQQGAGTARDFDKAEYWYGRGGTVGGWSTLGIIYHRGVGVSPDYAKSEQYYRKAAALGDPLAQYGLGALYVEGHIKTLDDVEAYKWLLLAHRSATRTPGCGLHYDCVELAIKDKPGYRRLLRSRLSTAEVEEAERRVLEWKKSKDGAGDK